MLSLMIAFEVFELCQRAQNRSTIFRYYVLNPCAKATEAHALSHMNFSQLSSTWTSYCSLVCSLIRSWAALHIPNNFEGFLGTWSQSQFRRLLTCDLQGQTAVSKWSIDKNRTLDSINNPRRALALRDSSQSRQFHYVQPPKIHNTARQRSNPISCYSREVHQFLINTTSIRSPKVVILIAAVPA